MQGQRYMDLYFEEKQLLSEAELLNIAETGDLLLFQTNHIGAKF